MAISMKLPAEIKRMGRIFGLYYLGSVGGTFLGMFMVTFNDGIHSSASEIEQVLGPFIFPIMAVLWIPFVPIMALPTYRFLVEDRAMIVA